MSTSATEKAGMIGKILAEYRIVEELGGQAGVDVYKAIGFNARRPVAIKLFPTALSRDKPRLQALLDSLRKLSGLDQPGIPRLIGSGLNGGRAYIITPYMTGGTLQDRIRIGLISAGDALRLLDKIAGALERAHELGVVHGHLSSAEVMFDDTGQPQIIGLGQASILVNDPGSAVEEGEQIAPEVRAGEQPTPASDQYSIAVMAFELLTGRCVEETIKGDTQDAAEPETTSPSGIQLSPQVAEVLKRALQDDPSKRYPGIGAMVHELRMALGSEADTGRAARSTAAAGGPSARIGRSLRWGILSLAAVTLACFALSLPALAAARWMGLDLGSVSDLFGHPRPTAEATPAWDPLRSYVPGPAASMPRPTSAEAQGVLPPVQPQQVDPPKPTEAEAPGGIDREKVAPTELPAANQPSIDQQALGTSVPGSASIENTPDPQGALPQASPTPIAPPATPIDWNGCSNGSQGCSETLPTQ